MVVGILLPSLARRPKVAAVQVALNGASTTATVDGVRGPPSSGDQALPAPARLAVDGGGPRPAARSGSAPPSLGSRMMKRATRWTWPLCSTSPRRGYPPGRSTPSSPETDTQEASRAPMAWSRGLTGPRPSALGTGSARGTRGGERPVRLLLRCPGHRDRWCAAKGGRHAHRARLPCRTGPRGRCGGGGTNRGRNSGATATWWWFAIARLDDGRPMSTSRTLWGASDGRQRRGYGGSTATPGPPLQSSCARRGADRP